MALSKVSLKCATWQPSSRPVGRARATLTLDGVGADTLYRSNSRYVAIRSAPTLRRNESRGVRGLRVICPGSTVRTHRHERHQLDTARQNHVNANWNRTRSAATVIAFETTGTECAQAASQQRGEQSWQSPLLATERTHDTQDDVVDSPPDPARNGTAFISPITSVTNLIGLISCSALVIFPRLLVSESLRRQRLSRTIRCFFYMLGGSVILHSLGR